MNKTTLIIAEGTKEIDYIWGKIEEIVIPDGVIRIGYDAFAVCKSLKSIYIDREKGSLSLSLAGIPETTKVYWRGEF